MGTSHYYIEEIIEKVNLKSKIKSIFLLKYNKEYLKKNNTLDDKEKLV
jgi:hypothetical protein